MVLGIGKKKNNRHVNIQEYFIHNQVHQVTEHGLQ
jgi:hypothetical protein